MGTFNGRIICAALLVLFGMTACSATRSLLFPYHGGYGGGYGGGFPGFGGGYGGFGGGFPGFGGGYSGFGGGFPGFGGGFGGFRKDMKVGAGAGSVNEHEEKTGGFHADGKQNIEKGHDYGVHNAVNSEGAEKGPDGVAEGLGFGTKGHEESGFGEVIGYNEGGEKGGYGGTVFGIPEFGGTGFGEGSGHEPVAVKPGTTP